MEHVNEVKFTVEEWMNPCCGLIYLLQTLEPMTLWNQGSQSQNNRQGKVAIHSTIYDHISAPGV